MAGVHGELHFETSRRRRRGRGSQGREPLGGVPGAGRAGGTQRKLLLRAEPRLAKSPKCFLRRSHTAARSFSKRETERQRWRSFRLATLERLARGGVLVAVDCRGDLVFSPRRPSCIGARCGWIRATRLHTTTSATSVRRTRMTTRPPSTTTNSRSAAPQTTPARPATPDTFGLSLSLSLAFNARRSTSIASLLEGAPRKIAAARAFASLSLSLSLSLDVPVSDCVAHSGSGAQQPRVLSEEKQARPGGRRATLSRGHPVSRAELLEKLERTLLCSTRAHFKLAWEKVAGYVLSVSSALRARERVVRVD